jgi:anhydro-N-acetylmuramic acid kinase
MNTQLKKARKPRAPRLSTNLNIVGIMNGTSLDGIDYVLCHFKDPANGDYLKVQPKLKLSASFRFSSELKAKLKRAAMDQMTTSQLSLLHYELGALYATHLVSLKKKGWKFHAVGLHGQTIFHAGQKATWQIGSAYPMAAQLNVKVVSNFREADVATGGQGAPLAPFFHLALLNASHIRNSEIVAFHNLGGMSNLTWLDVAGAKSKILAFDTGPANMLIDLVMAIHSNSTKSFDKGGAVARTGLPQPILLNEMLKHPFFSKKPPKSCGREEFGEVFIKAYERELRTLSPEDQLATLTELTARSIAMAYESLVPQVPSKIFFSGGGAHNTYLLSRIQYLMPNTVVQTTADLGWDVSSIEGGAFAYLAYLRLKGVRVPVSRVTGAPQDIFLGTIAEV